MTLEEQLDKVTVELQSADSLITKLHKQLGDTEAERDSLRERVATLHNALRLAALYVAKANADGAYNNTAMSGDRALMVINEALGYKDTDA